MAKTARTSLDTLDKQIIDLLSLTGDLPLADIAAKLDVTPGTIHVRIKRLKEMSIIKGTRIILDNKKIGFDIEAFIGIKLHKAKDYVRFMDRIKNIPEVIEAHYATGPYNTMLKVLVRDISELHSFLMGKIQKIDEVHSTDTLIVLESPVLRGRAVSD